MVENRGAAVENSSIFPFDVQTLFAKYRREDALPKNDFEKQAILVTLIAEFANEVRYPEGEVNARIKKSFSDAAFMHRELVNFGYLSRDPLAGEYWVTKRTLTIEDVRKNTLLARHAKSFGIE